MDTLEPIADDANAVAEDLKSQGVAYVLGAWSDVLGRAKSKLVPIDHYAHLVAGSERYTPRGMGDLGRMNPNEPECVAVPDASTLQILPWDKRVAFMNADLMFDGKEPWENCPRSILKSVTDKAAKLGYKFNLGVENEFYVFKRSELPNMVPLSPIEELFPTPCYDVETAMDSLDFLDRLSSYMTQTGFDLFSFDHEGGDGQYEYDYSHDEVLATCDRVMLFRLMVKQVAKEFGGVATFMPKPMKRVWGSGAHMNMSIENIDTDENLFRKDGEWTKLTYSFMAGVLKHAPALNALTCPTVNSYKRLVGKLHDGSISWAPVWAAWGENNRSCMLRVPDNRPAIENRAVDSAANMYLASAFTLAAGLEGIEQGLEPGDPVVNATYDWDPRANSVGDVKHLPRTLLEAVEVFDADPLSREVFSPTFVQEYVDMKYREWEDYNSQVTQWEVDRYLENL